MLVDVLARLENQWRLRVLLLHHQSIAERRELIGKECEEPDDGIIFVGRNERAFLPCPANFVRESDAALRKRTLYFCDIGSVRRPPQYLPDSQIPNDICAEPHRHCGLS